ncbi:ABC transporter permease [Bacillus ginsengihumi]|uniref:ABC transporter permease n=1 Tax=Heyndrickxia ginsengihumi TaxID=363870 RepID=A0A6M0P443_9BACI|nr:ABC transporter permease [Heyndrickxia ginsengihumi]NEY19005.1 ABC transporter permease [Heyndrickxia ginsengihumi]
MRITAMIKRIVQEMFRDKRTLALLFCAPLLILSLMYFFFNGKTVDPSLGVVHIDSQLVNTLKHSGIDIKHYDHATSETVKKDNLDGVLKVDKGKWTLILQNSDPNKAKSLEMKVKQAVASQVQMTVKQHVINVKQPKIGMETKYVYGNKDTTFFDVLSPVLVGFFVFFFVFLISGIGMLKERTKGTLEKVLSTPIRRREIVVSYLVGYGIFALIQTIIVVLFSTTVLDVVLVGSIWNVILINLLLALVALSLGTLLSTFASSEFQMLQFIPIVVVPQVFFSGIFPLDSMANWLQLLGKIMPIYYGADALKAVMYKGLSISDVGGDIIALLVFAIIFILLNIVALKRYRVL